MASQHEHILMYAKLGALAWKDVRNLLPDTNDGYSNQDDDPRGPWRSVPFSAQGFAMIERDMEGRDPRQQLIDKIEGR
jgi:adenine-specific DNA-methyltransferase